MTEHRAPEAIAPRHGRGAATDEAFGARHHDVVKRRTSKGGQTAKVVKRGTPYVIGSWSHDADGAAGWSGAVAVAIEQHAGRYGARAAEILAVTQELFGGEIDELLGTDAMSFEEVVHPTFDTVTLDGVTLDGEPITTTIGPDPSMCRVAVSHAGITGADRVADVDGFAAHADVYGAHTSNVTRWPTRYGLRTVQPRKGEREASAPTSSHRRTTIGYRTDQEVSTTIRHRTYTAPRWQTSDRVTAVRPATVSTLIAPTDDPRYVFVGHRKMERPQLAHVKRGGKRKARTVRDEPASLLGDRETLHDIIGAMTRGQRITIGPDVTVTVSPKGKYNVTDKRPDARKRTRTCRTVDAVAIGLTQ